MAEPAEKPANADEIASPPEVLSEYEVLRRHCAKLYGFGLKRKEIARGLLEHLSPNSDKSTEVRLKHARVKLKRWEQQASFRDMVHEHARIALDIDSVSVYNGLLRQAKRGKVDAAKLVFELTGRYNPKGDQQPTQVAVVIGNIPRPIRSRDEVITIDVDEDQDESLIDADDEE